MEIWAVIKKLIPSSEYLAAIVCGLVTVLFIIPIFMIGVSVPAFIYIKGLKDSLIKFIKHIYNKIHLYLIGMT